MGVVRGIFIAFSYLYHVLLALFLAAVAGLALVTAPQSLHLDMLPWTAPTLGYIVFFGALIGLLTVVLAVMGRLRFLFFLWSLVVAVMMFRGFFFSGYRFEPGSGGPKTAVYLIVGSLIALLGAWWQMVRRKGPKRY